MGNIVDKEFKENITRYLNDERISVWICNGMHYGYPACCIEDFCDRGFNPKTPDQLKAHNDTGFIPCPNHARMIVNGDIKIEDLISNRVDETDFPNG